MNDLEYNIREFLRLASEGKALFSDKVLDECLLGIRKSILQGFHEEQDTTFRLRMSNIGKDLRQLMLEKEYGREKPSPEFLLKMMSGSVQEHILIYILKSIGAVIHINGEVSLDIDGEIIDGTYDLVYKGKMFDVKTCSDYAFKNKFVDYSSFAAGDSFGYVDQLLGYSLAEGVEPGGWLVYNKNNSEFKVLEYPYAMSAVEDAFRKRLGHKIEAIKKNEMPECTGLENELWYGKPSGNVIIGEKCRWCSCKTRCHPTAVLESSRVSKAKNAKMVHYVD